MYIFISYQNLPYVSKNKNNNGIHPIYKLGDKIIAFKQKMQSIRVTSWSLSR